MKEIIHKVRSCIHRPTRQHKDKSKYCRNKNKEETRKIIKEVK